MPSDSPEAEIRDQLATNFQEYTKNPILNNFTPTRTPISQPDHHDSNIVTSPVKTMRRTYQTDEYDTTNENTRNLDKSTVNVPLNDSSKPVLRKGTPKFTKLKVSSANAVANSFSSSNLERAMKGSQNNQVQDDEFDDDDDDHERKSNETLLSDFPNDLLSPEKHVYPEENLKREVSADTSKTTILQKMELYPELSAKSYSTPSKVSTTKHIISSNSGLRASGSLVPTTSQKSSFLSNSAIKSPEKLSLSPISHRSPRTQLKSPATYKSSVDNTRNSSNFKAGISSPPVRVKQPSTRTKEVTETSKPSVGSKYESSEEEPDVPELTVQLSKNNGNTNKRKRTPVDSDDHEIKKSKKALYPSLVPNYKLNDSSIVDESFISTARVRQENNRDISSLKTTKLSRDDLKGSNINDDLRQLKGIDEIKNTKVAKTQSLYPQLPQFNTAIEIDDLSTIPNGQSTTTNFNINQTKDNLSAKQLGQRTIEIFERKNQEKAESQVSQGSTQMTPETQPTQVSPSLLSTNLLNSNELAKGKKVETRQSNRQYWQSNEVNNSNHINEDKPPGDSNNWNNAQWKLFFKNYAKYRKLYKEKKGKINKDSIFNGDVLRFLKCDLREIQLKIRFTDENWEEFKKGGL